MPDQTRNLNSVTDFTGTLDSNDRIIMTDNKASLKALTTAILGKAMIEGYTGSSLAGSSQSVKSAIDGLNSNMADTRQRTLMGDSTALTGVDYNTLESGWHFIGTGSTNGPGLDWLLVHSFNNQGGGKCQQAYTLTGRIFNRANNGTTWSSWLEIADKASVDALNSKTTIRVIQQGEDVFTLAETYPYLFMVSGTTGVTNLPTGFNEGLLRSYRQAVSGARRIIIVAYEYNTVGMRTWECSLFNGNVTRAWSLRPTRAEMDTLKVGTPINHMRFFGNNNKTYDILRFCYDESESEYIQVIFDVNDKSIALYKKTTDGTETFIGKVTLT